MRGFKIGLKKSCRFDTNCVVLKHRMSFMYLNDFSRDNVIPLTLTYTLYMVGMYSIFFVIDWQSRFSRRPNRLVSFSSNTRNLGLSGRIRGSSSSNDIDWITFLEKVNHGITTVEISDGGVTEILQNLG